MKNETTPNLSKNALTVLEKRYLRRDATGKTLENPADMFRRVADTIAAADAVFDKKADVTALSNTFYNMMTSFEFLPNSPTLMNAGRKLGQLSACFVLPAVFPDGQGRCKRQRHELPVLLPAGLFRRSRQARPG